MSKGLSDSHEFPYDFGVSAIDSLCWAALKPMAASAYVVVRSINGEEILGPLETEGQILTEKKPGLLSLL
jgi:hypothetical protein